MAYDRGLGGAGRLAAGLWRPRLLVLCAAPALACAGAGGSAVTLGGWAAAAHGRAPRARTAAAPRAHDARTLRVNDTGRLSLVKAFGSVLVEQGHASGTLSGQARVRMRVSSSIAATFSISTSAGTIYGRGGATLHSSGRYASFGGWLSVDKGSGRFARAHGSGKLYGAIDRRTHALTVQTLGSLSY